MMIAIADKAVAALDLEPIKAKLMHAQSGEGWSQAKADAVEVEYRRFLTLMKAWPNETAAPLVDIDTFWHYHILDTAKYAHDCDAVFGHFLHHYPYLGMGDEADQAAHEQGAARMAALYADAFGEDYAQAAARMAGSAQGQAFCAVSAPQAAFCAVSKPANAFCAVSKPAAAFCAVTKPAAAFCAVSKSASAFCAVTKPAAAFCAVNKSAAAFCAVSKSASAFCAVTKPAAAFCAVSKPESAFCAIARPQAAFCAVAADDQRAKAPTAELA